MSRRGSRILCLVIVVGVVALHWWLVRRAGPSDAGPEAAPLLDLRPVRAAAEAYLDEAREDLASVTALEYVTADFRKRLESEPPGQIRRYEYDAATITGHDIAPDRSSVEFRGEVQVVRVREYTENRPGHSAYRQYRTGGRAGFRLRVVRGSGEAGWQVDAFDFEKRPPHVGLVATTSQELRDFLGGIFRFPGPALQGRTEQELAAELGTCLWGFYHVGGPIEYRLGLDEVGQTTMGAERLNRLLQDHLRSDKEEETFWLGMRQASSERLQRVLPPQGGAVPDTGSVAVRSWTSGAPFVTSIPWPFLWFHWEKVERREWLYPGTLPANEEVKVFAIEATEGEVPAGKTRRVVRLALFARRTSPP
jgi:hypothetical protein